MISPEALRVSEEDRLLDSVLESGEPGASKGPVGFEPRALSRGQSARVAPIITRLSILFGITTAIAASWAWAPQGNAQVSPTETGVELTFFGDWLETLSEDSLAHVIGHELGHVAAHDRGTRFGHALDAAKAKAAEPICRRFLWSAELTADRFALCAAPDLAPERASQLHGATDLDATFVRIDELAGSGQSDRSSHPEPAVRLYASWLFAQSDRFRTLTGVGPGHLEINDIDTRIARLLPAIERPVYSLGGLDVLDTPDWLERRWQARRKLDTLIDV